MTAHAMQEDRDKSLAAGMDDHITKPIEPQVLARTLAQWVQPRARPSETAKTRRKTRPRQIRRQVFCRQ